MLTRWSLNAAVVIPAIVAGATLALAPTAQAQRTNYSSGTTTNGLFGQNTVGGNGSTNGGQSGGQNTSGGSSAAQGGAGGGMDTTNVAFSSQSLRPTVTTTQQRGAFVGADSGDSVNVRSLQGNTNSRGQANGLAQLQNLFSQGLQNVNNANSRNQSQTQIRVALKLGFTPSTVAAPMQVRAFETRITKLPGLHFVGQPQVTMEGRTAVLRGKVASEDDRKLAAALALMEPQVLDVRNELVVDPSGATAEELPLSPAATP